LEEWIWSGVNLAVGIALFGVALLIPFRRQYARPEVTRDLLAVAATFAFALGAEYMLGAGLEWTAGFPLMERWFDTLNHWPLWVLVAGNLVVSDLIAYWAHRMLHTSVLWHTHAWHHASKYLYWASGLRGSPIHVLMLAAPSYLIYYLFPSPETGMASAILVISDILTQHITHSNIRVPFAKQVEWAFVTPRFHFVHHSADVKRGNSNYGFTFTWWDHLFGTYTDPETAPVDDRLGLTYETTNLRLILGLPPRRDPVASR